MRNLGGLFMNAEGRTILLVEDDPNDVFFIKYAFESAGIRNPVCVLEDGIKFVRYLTGEGPYGDRQQYPWPILVLLDLKLPGKMGLEVLRWVQQHPYLRSLVIIILTSSSARDDIDEAYRLGARSFIVKPFSVDDRLELAKAIKAFWLDWSQFPTSWPDGTVD